MAGPAELVAGPAGRVAGPVKPGERAGPPAGPEPRRGHLLAVARALWLESLGVHATLEPPPPGARAIERYAVLPTARTARRLVPLGSPAAAASAVTGYPGLLAPATRPGRALLAAALGTGWADRVVPDRLHVWAEPGGEAAAGSLTHHLREVLGHEDLVFSISVTGRGPNGKPVLQALTPDGAGVAFAKVGWNAATAELVRNEGRVLSEWSRSPPDAPAAPDAPRLVHSGTWNGLQLLVTAALPRSIRRHRPKAPPPLEATLAVARRLGIEEAPLGSGRYWTSVAERLERAAHHDPGIAPVLDRVRTALLERYAAVPVRLGAWHGDWVPWNMGWAGDRLHVWDWEHAGDAVPVGFDLLHYVTQRAFVARRRPLAAAAAEGRGALPSLPGTEVPAEARRPMAALYLLETFLRANRAVRAGGRYHPRLYPEILRLLADAAASR